jgi:hypothetical protein
MLLAVHKRNYDLTAWYNETYADRVTISQDNALEIILKIIARFQRYGGVYFYSMLAASMGIIIHALGYFLYNWQIKGLVPLAITMACGGGMLMITGQSIVIWLSH